MNRKEDEGPRVRERPTGQGDMGDRWNGRVDSNLSDTLSKSKADIT